MAFLFALSWNKNHHASSPALLAIHDSVTLRNTPRTTGQSWPRTISPPPGCRASWSPSCRGRTCESWLSRSNILAWEERGETFRVSPPAGGRVCCVKSVPLVQFKVRQLHRQLDERVRVQLFLLDSSFSESREGVTDNLQVLCLDDRRLSLHRPPWQRLFCLSRNWLTDSKYCFLARTMSPRTFSSTVNTSSSGGGRTLTVSTPLEISKR